MNWDNTIDGDPYGVPTGVVPRVRAGIPPATGYATTPHNPATQRPYPPDHPDHPDHPYQLTPEDEVEIERRRAEMVAAIELTALGPRPDPVQQAVDDYMLMERKAKAWDVLLAGLFPSEARVRAFMEELLKPPA